VADAEAAGDEPGAGIESSDEFFALRGGGGFRDDEASDDVVDLDEPSDLAELIDDDRDVCVSFSEDFEEPVEAGAIGDEKDGLGVSAGGVPCGGVGAGLEEGLGAEEPYDAAVEGAPADREFGVPGFGDELDDVGLACGFGEPADIDARRHDVTDAEFGESEDVGEDSFLVFVEPAGAAGEVEKRTEFVAGERFGLACARGPKDARERCDESGVKNGGDW